MTDDLQDLFDGETVAAQQAIDRLQKRLAAEKDRTQALMSAVYQAVEDSIGALTIPAVKPPRRDRRIKDEETAILILSDWQLGKKTPTYSSEVCEERIGRLVEKASRLVEIQRADHPVKRLAVFLLGDMIEGELIFPGQAWQVDSSLFRQVTVDGPRILANLIRWGQSEFETVEVHAVPGNHGYLGGRARKDMHPESNGDRMLYQITSQLIPDVEWSIAEDWWTVADLGEHCRFLLLHGQQVRGFAGIPWYGWQRKLLAWGSMSTIWNEMQFDHAAAGHFHTPVSLYVNGKRLWINASTESHNPYALEQLAAAGEPAQWLLFCKPGRGVTCEYLVNLD